MAKVIPFRGIYYNRDKVKGSEVAAPPYDVISSEMKDALYSLSPYNVVRIDYGKDAETDTDEENRYTRAARFLDEWLSDGLLIRSERPTFYAYRMDYFWRGRRMSLTGPHRFFRHTEACGAWRGCLSPRGYALQAQVRPSCPS
jgi:uncharacterized protein (DUF1015 family)